MSELDRIMAENPQLGQGIAQVAPNPERAPFIPNEYERPYVLQGRDKMNELEAGWPTAQASAPAPPVALKAGLPTDTEQQPAPKSDEPQGIPGSWANALIGLGMGLQGKVGDFYQMQQQQLQRQQEMQAKREKAKEEKQQKRFDFMVKANESPDPDVRKRMMKAALQAGVITEQDEAVLSKVPSGKLKMWAPRLQKESPAIWTSYRNGELPDAIVNEIIKQQESRDAEEYAMQRIPELEKERDSGSISPTNRAMLDFFEKTYGPQLLKFKQEREALEKAQRENRKGAATEQLDIDTERDKAEQAIIKTQQDRLDVQLRKAQIASAEQARIGANDPSYQMYRNDLHDIEGAFGLKVPLLDAAGNFNPQALSGGGVDMKGLHRAIDRYIADKKKLDSVREYMRQFKTTILEPEENAVKRDADSATKELGDAFPPATWKGKRKLDSKTGVTYESDGNTWKPVK